jgi:hypothetical protein
MVNYQEQRHKSVSRADRNFFNLKNPQNIYQPLKPFSQTISKPLSPSQSLQQNQFKHVQDNNIKAVFNNPKNIRPSTAVSKSFIKQQVIQSCDKVIRNQPNLGNKIQSNELIPVNKFKKVSENIIL